MGRTLVHQRKNTEDTTPASKQITDKGDVVRARVRFLLVRPLSNIGQNEMRSINSLWFVLCAQWVRARTPSVLSRQDFLTSLKIYHLINFMASYFSLLSSCLVHIIIIFLVVCLCLFSNCFRHSRIYIHLKARKTFPIRCSALYVIFSRVSCANATLDKIIFTKVMI